MMTTIQKRKYSIAVDYPVPPLKEIGLREGNCQLASVPRVKQNARKDKEAGKIAEQSIKRELPAKGFLRGIV